MPVTLDQLDVEVEAQKKLQKACGELGLDKLKCKKLEGYIADICRDATAKPRRKGVRALSRWQQCIKERRAGKKFDPQAMKKLSAEYRAGRCPSGA